MRRLVEFKASSVNLHFQRLACSRLVALAVYFLLCITSPSRTGGGATQPTFIRRFSMQRLETFMLGIPLLFGVLTSTAGLLLDLYHPLRLGIGCWISSYDPVARMGYIGLEGGGVGCTTSVDKKTVKYVLMFGGIAFVSSCLSVIFCMVMIMWTVKRRTRLMEERYAVIPQQNRRNENAAARLRETSIQSSLYICAFILVYHWPTVNRLLEIYGDGTPIFITLLLSQICAPLQGFFNFFIYFRPRYTQLCMRYPESSVWWKSKWIFCPYSSAAPAAAEQGPRSSDDIFPSGPFTASHTKTPSSFRRPSFRMSFTCQSLQDNPTTSASRLATMTTAKAGQTKVKLEEHTNDVEAIPRAIIDVSRHAGSECCFDAVAGENAKNSIICR